MQSKIVSDLSDVKESDMVYDIDVGVNSVLLFLDKTELHRKEFDKLVSKNRSLSSFFRNKLYYTWNHILKESFYRNGELNNISVKELEKYVLGIYKVSKATDENLKRNRDRIIANALYELTERLHNKC